jgi:hypothetical protein
MTPTADGSACLAGYVPTCDRADTTRAPPRANLFHREGTGNMATPSTPRRTRRAVRRRFTEAETWAYCARPQRDAGHGPVLESLRQPSDVSRVESGSMVPQVTSRPVDCSNSSSKMRACEMRLARANLGRGYGRFRCRSTKPPPAGQSDALVHAGQGAMAVGTGTMSYQSYSAATFQLQLHRWKQHWSDG